MWIVSSSLLVFSFLASAQGIFTVETMAQVTYSLQEHFKIGCVFFIHASNGSKQDIHMAGLGSHALIPDGQTQYNPGKSSLTRSLLQLRLQKISKDRLVQMSVIDFDNLLMNNESGTCRNRPLHVLYADAKNVRTSLEQLSHQEIGISKARWLLFVNHGSADEFLANVHIPFDCLFLAAVQLNSSTVSLVEKYRVAARWPLRSFDFGVWSSKSSLNATRLGFYERRSNLEGITLPCLTKSEPPFQNIIIKDNEILPEGFFPAVWKALSERMNFRVKYLPLMESPPRMDIFLQKLEKNKSHAIIFDVTQTSNRAARVDFTQLLLPSRFAIFVRQSGRFSWTDYLKPFSGKLWLAVGSILIVLPVCLALLDCITSQYEKKARRFGLYDSILFVFGALCNQGHEVTPHWWCGRVVFLLAYVITVTLYAVYSGTLISFLAVERVHTPFQTLQDMLDDGTYQLGMITSGGPVTIFENTSNALLLETYYKFIEPHYDNMPQFPRDGFYEICNSSSFAFMTSVDDVLLFPEGPPCKVLEIPQASIKNNLAIALRKGSPYRRLINYNLKNIHSSGILKMLYLRYWPRKLNNEDSPVICVTLKDITPILVLLAIAMIASIILLMAEIYVGNSHSHQQRKFTA